MKKIFVLVACLCAHCVLFAQVGESPKSAFQLSFISPLGTNGLHSAQYTNSASLNMLAGVSRNEEAFTLGGLANVILNDAKGIQIAGLSNYVGNEGQGLQFAGLANVNKNKFSGSQFAGLLNTAGKVKGFQFAGLVNIAKDVKGFQFAGLVNIAKNMKGAQFGGLVNIAKDVKGAQFAGLVNIAENSDCPIGLVNIIKNGEKSIAITYDIQGSTIVSFRSGGKYTYGILGVGYNHKMEENSLVTEVGLGAHLPIASWFRINHEIKFSSIGCDSSKPVIHAGYSLIPAFKIGRHFELFAGASINYMESKNMNDQKIFPNHSLWKSHGSTKLKQLYVGYEAGIQYIF